MPAEMRDGEILRAYLAERDAPCPGCGYSLRGLAGERCPECNQELRLQVGLVEPRLAWFVTGVVGLSMGIGFGVLGIGAEVIEEILGGRNGSGHWVGWGLLSMAVLEGVLLWCWVENRRAVGRMGAGARWTLAAGTVALAFVLVFGCFL